MSGLYGGLVVIMIYATAEPAKQDSVAIFTESDLPILTENSDEILTE